MSDKTVSKTTTIHALRGMVDLLPAQARVYRHVEAVASRLFSLYGYSEVRTPCIEATELFARTAGDASDIVVSKQMYTFTDAGDRSNTLRPEGTAGVVRALVEHGTLKEMPMQKLYYLGPMFRYEKPQKGRQRQFHQAGVEFLGVGQPAAEAEVIGLCHQLLLELGFKGAVTHINSIGCAECRRRYNEILRDAIESNRDAWCDQCRERAISNPMRVFDCKVESCKRLVAELPRISDFLCEDCQAHFDEVKQLLTDAGIPFKADGSLVRGFDYYTRTVFEVLDSNIGAQSAILGGGRYDNLVEELGGPPTPAVGMGVGLERLILAMEANGIVLPLAERPSIYALAIDEASFSAMFDLVQKLRGKMISVEFECRPRSIKAGLKAATRVRARHALIMGTNELENGIVQWKDLDTGEQKELLKLTAVQTFTEFLRPVLPNED